MAPLWFVVRLEYKYSRLVMSANKDCELPAADSCALAEGEEPDDDVVYTQKPSLLGKLRAIANKVCICVPHALLTTLIHCYKNCSLRAFFVILKPETTRQFAAECQA